MKSILVSLGALIIVGVVWWLWPEPPITNYPSSGTEIIAFGDSLIEGVGSTAGGDLVSRLSDGIGQPIVNLGVSGDTTADGLARIDEVLERDAKVVIVLLGGNDSIKKVSPETTKSNLASIISQIQADGAVVVLLGVRGGLLADAYKDIYKDLAKEYGTAYVPDVLSGVFGRANLMADPIHPNNTGYEKIFERVLPVLESVL